MGRRKYWTPEELSNCMAESDHAKEYQRALSLLNGEGTEKDAQGALELFRKLAIEGFIPAMYKMAWFCHDDREDLATQDREEELFWYCQTIGSQSGKEVLYHAQNMMEGSYDRRFGPSAFIPVLEMAAALGNEQSKEYLAGYYAGLKDPVSLQKSLYWFYSIQALSPRLQREFKEVKKALGLE